jgi:spore maturation protein CgeB
MKLVIFGLTISSSWGNGHATLWRGLLRALIHRGHTVIFIEKDLPYYAAHRDLTELPGGQLLLYHDWQETLPSFRAQLADADIAMVTSYCPDALIATTLVLDSSAGLKTFYDLDTPVTLATLAARGSVPYLGPGGLAGFDLVLSYTGGAALDALQTGLGAARVAPLYGSVDPDQHRPVEGCLAYGADLSYLGTYAQDRQQSLLALFIEPARQMPGKKFVLAGAQYPQNFPWTNNIFFFDHLPPAEHPAFFSSSHLTLNITRAPMARMGYCPSGRLFEAAACGAPILSDCWEGLDQFYTPGEQILIASSPEEAIAALQSPPDTLARIRQAARERTLDQHTASHRALELEQILAQAWLAPVP